MATTNQESLGLQVSEIESAGHVTDDQGHIWAVPESDLGGTLQGGELDIPKTARPDFSYFWKRADRVPAAMMEWYRPVPVTTQELGLPDFDTGKMAESAAKFGAPLDGYYRKGDLVLMKTPKVLYDRQIARHTKEAARRVSDLGNPHTTEFKRMNKGNKAPVESSLEIREDFTEPKRTD